MKCFSRKNRKKKRVICILLLFRKIGYELEAYVRFRFGSRLRPRRQMVNGSVGCSSLQFGCNFIAADDNYLNDIMALIVFFFLHIDADSSVTKSTGRCHRVAD